MRSCNEFNRQKRAGIFNRLIGNVRVQIACAMDLERTDGLRGGGQFVRGVPGVSCVCCGDQNE